VFEYRDYNCRENPSNNVHSFFEFVSEVCVLPDGAHVCLNPVTHEECNRESEFRNYLEAGASPTGWGPRREPKRDANPRGNNKTIMHRSGHYTVTASSLVHAAALSTCFPLPTHTTPSRISRFSSVLPIKYRERTLNNCTESQMRR
jgi:hypothetical protein